MALKQEIENDIVLAGMMADDLDKMYKKYAKAALEAQNERINKIREEKYHGCSNADELHDLYGQDIITLDEYDAGRDFFDGQEERKRRMSFIERHRKNLKDLRDLWRGTVKELQEELDEMNGVVKDTRTYLEKLEAEERAERYKQLY